MKDSFVFYKSFYEAIHKLKNKELKADIFEAICELALNENVVELDDSIGQIIMDLISPQIEANNKRYSNGCKGGRPKNKTTSNNEEKPMVIVKENQTETKLKPNENENVNVNDNDNKKKIIKEKNFSFIKPSVEEIKQYCLERNNFINPQQFYDFYESKNWYVGKSKMKDWKACIRTWEQRSLEKKKNNNVPEWFDKDIRLQPMNEQEEKEIEELLREFK